MPTYRVTDTDTGREINPGDTVTDFRGETGTFERVTRGPEYNGTAKVVVSGRETYERVWGLTVETLPDPLIESCRLSENTRAVVLADGALMVTRGDFVAPSVALRLDRDEQAALAEFITNGQSATATSDECGECGRPIPVRDGGGMTNRYHDQSCSLHDPNEE